MDTNITHDGPKGRFYIAGPEKDKGFLTYSIKDGVMNISGTYVDPAYRGHQYARNLVDAGIELAKSKQLKINPTCSYALKVVERDYPDLMI